jgi:hypothetical protein
MRRPPCPATITEDGTVYRCIKPRWHWGRLYGRAHDSGPGWTQVIWARDFWRALGPWAPVIPRMEPIEWGKR